MEGFVGLPAGHPLRERIAGKPSLHKWPQWRVSYLRSQVLRDEKAEGRPPSALRDYYRNKVWSQADDGHPAGGYDVDYAAAGIAHAANGPRGEDDPILLPAALQQYGLTDLDVLKIDVDGPDFEILRSANEILDRPSLLAVGIEVNFVGSHDANDNSFHNVDRLMREKGFDLFGLTARQYSSAVLPWPYLDRYPALTAGGRPVQGDAFYARDLASPMRRAEAEAVTDEKLAKLAAIFALANLPDEAAEILLTHEGRLAKLLDLPESLDLLALQIQEPDGTRMSYLDYIAAFEREEPQFFDQYGRRQRWLDDLIEAAR